MGTLRRARLPPSHPVAPRVPEPARALTLIQPWAWAVLRLGKRLENRPWWPYGLAPGDSFAIHAGAGWDEDAAVELAAPRVLLAQAVVGVAIYLGATDEPLELPPAQRRWWSGPVGWRLGRVLELRRPLPCRGTLGLWRLPPAVRLRLRNDLRSAILRPR